MKKICILTATRAEYGLLKPVIESFVNRKDIDLRVVVTGAHLSPEFGLTYEEIINDGIEIDKKIEILVSADTPSAISKSMGLAMIGFADYFSESMPDLLVVLGDRYETLAVTTVAMNQRIPIAHLYGGEATEGLIDESIRHSISKMSYLHFTSTEEYRKRVIQLGENPSRVFNVGAIGIENIKRNEYISKQELSNSINLSLDKLYAVVTFHPVTLEHQSSEHQISELLKAIAKHDEMNFIFTKGNSDVDGRIINSMIDEYVKDRENCVAVTSLGLKRYLTAIRYCQMVIGNSSSGIIEVPSFKVPTINIGDRQKGRIQADSIINCAPDFNSISDAIDKGNDTEVRASIQLVKNPYENDNTTCNIVSIIEDFLLNNKIDIKKRFYDLN
ncbi:UDP-N-acetylglucosamine 2-epimerase [Helicovermis profundi]|uniref:UDP-N-acetylglucosamine 2-epimerase n=1 Tax=Helicovermis profundi TaxID=3065157 RepID=A0AAU9EHN2_9FIRM|nr:UDP-N-acetylglucosamine 2-epimerase [Clostridia bacterium S502]